MQFQDLNSLTTTDLEKLNERVSSILKVRKESERTETIEKIKSMAEQAGLSVSIREGGAGAGDKRGAPPRYRNPANESDTWSGRGRAPKWLVELESKGRKRAEFLIARA